MRWSHGLQARLRLLFRRASEERMDEEMRFHLEMETEQYLRQGLSPAEARRQARLAFGGMEGHREAVRDGRTLAWIGGLSLDLKLGVRMMVKHPALTLIGGLGMAVAVGIGAGVFGFVSTMINPALPLDEGHRIVSIQNNTDVLGAPDRRSLHDFVAWRQELKGVQELSAFRELDRTLVTGEGPPEPVPVAEMTASGFNVARVPPLLGRYLVAEDETPGAAPVVVIGEGLWRRRFDGDPRLVGRTVQLGGTVHTVVGVMPAGFAFPLRHEVWTPLRLDPLQHKRGEGPSLYVFGRLAPGVGFDEARAELKAIGQRMAAAFPDTHGRLRPEVMPYTYTFAGAESPLVVWAFHLLKLFASLLVVVVAVNVAILVYARTAMRQDEIAVRTALGASRRRIVTQLFVEALVLSLLSAAVGVAIAGVALKRFHAGEVQSGTEVPFWLQLGLTRGMVVYAVGLAVLGALIVGVGPGLQATGRHVQARLQELSSGGTGIRLGRTWMALIVTQVAIAVAVLPPALFYAGTYLAGGLADPGKGLEPFLTGVLLAESTPASGAGAEADASAYAARYADRQAELVRRLEAEPGVSDVIVTVGTPGQEWWTRIEAEGAPSAAVHEVGYRYVGEDFFEGFGVPLLTGRYFHAADRDTAATAVIVNQAFVQEVLGGGSALGRRIRRPVSGGLPAGEEAQPERWSEIVGVVGDFPTNRVELFGSRARLYEPINPAMEYAVSLTLRMEGRAPASFTGRFRELTAAVDPTLRLEELQPLDEALRDRQGNMRLLATLIGLATLSVLVLSAGGIYALMSFAVTRRRREIGIRSALGAHPRRILQGIFARAAGQLALGAGLGLALSVVLDVAAGGGLMGGRGAVLLPSVAALMGAVGLLAALGPARRALQIQPMEALRTDR